MRSSDHTDRRSAIRLASIAVVIGGAFWGLFWVPIRALEALGLTGAWPGLVIYVSALLLVTPFLFSHRLPPKTGFPLALAGLLTGAAFTFYGVSIVLTDVLRALLFFYLTPVWGTAIGIVLLGERLTLARASAVIMAISGLCVVLGFGEQSAINLGDAFAFAAGLFWAIGSYKVFTLPRMPTVHLSASFLLGSIIVTGILLLFGQDILGPQPAFPAPHILLPYALAAGLFAVPMIMLTMWPASVLTPGRIGILLMSEVVIGIISAALFAGEAVGHFEAIGAVLIITASLIEVLGNKA